MNVTDSRVTWTAGARGGGFIRVLSREAVSGASNEEALTSSWKSFGCLAGAKIRCAACSGATRKRYTTRTTPFRIGAGYCPATFELGRNGEEPIATKSNILFPRGRNLVNRGQAGRMSERLSVIGSRPPSYLRKSTLAAELDMSESTIDSYVQRGLLPKPIKRGGSVRWRWDDVERCLNTNSGSDNDPFMAGLDNV